MDCKSVQEFILTDYIDGQMGEGQKSLIDQHLSHCQACISYLNVLKNEVINPLINSSKDIPDEILWARIRQNLDREIQQQSEESLKPDFWEKLKLAVHMPRPAFALASFLTMIFMVGTMGQLFLNAHVVKISGQDQVEYLSSLIDGPVDVNNGNDPQTPIEKVFL